MKPTPHQPTPNQKIVWDALDTIVIRDHRAPTIRELQDFIGGMSTSTIQRLLIEGVEAGRVATWERDGKSTNYLPAWLQMGIDDVCRKEKEYQRRREIYAANQ